MNTFRLELPELFSGEDGKDFHQWIRRFELAIQVTPDGPSKAHILLPARLTGSAFVVYEGLSESEKKNFASIKAKLSQVFGRTQYLQNFKSCITARVRQVNEPLEVFAAAIVTMVEEAFPNYDAEAKEGESFRRFVAGLDTKLQVKIHELGGTTLSDALCIALRVERAQQTEKTQVSLNPNPVAATSEDPLYMKLMKRLDDLEKKMDGLSLSSTSHDIHHHRDDRHRSPSPSPYPRQSSRYRSPSPRHYAERRRSPHSEHYTRRSSSPTYSSSRRYTQESRGRQDSRSDYRARSPTPTRPSHRFQPDSFEQRYRGRSPSPPPSRSYSHQSRTPSHHVRFDDGYQGNFR